MKTFKFSLAAVLRYKRSLLDNALSELQSLQQDAEETERAILRNEQCYAERNHELRKISGEGATPSEIGVYRNYLAELNKKGLVLAEEKRFIMEKIAAKQQEILDYKKDINGLEKLETHQYDAYQAALRKAEEKMIEELLSSAHLRSV